jgi:[citrate (pro-3S)-lyase] ligase
LLERLPVHDARAFIEASGLSFEPEVDDLVGCYEHGRLVACGARAGYVLKMLAVDPDRQGSDLLGELVSELLASGFRAGHDSLLLFTLPQHVPTFQRLNFRLLAIHGQAALLEHGRGLASYLAAHAGDIPPGANGALVINGNPFSRGHLHLVETAAGEVDHLVVFIVREDRSAFPFEVRARLAREATAHLPNVTVLDTSRYAVSAATFPSYFLKRADAVAQAQMHLDLRLFATQLAPAFHIKVRFVGEEPLCPTTAAYNRVMASVLPDFGIRWVEVPRLAAVGQPISATRIREAFAAGDLAGLRDLVPPATMAFLASPEAAPIASRLRAERKEP